MARRYTRYLFFLLCVLRVGVWATAVAQEVAIRFDDPELLVLDEKYEQALALLRPKVDTCEGCVRERELVALCLIRLHRDLPRASLILESQPPTPLVRLLRAEALQLQYRFAEAKKAYEEYLASPDVAFLSSTQVQQRIADCQNALQLTQSSYSPYCSKRRVEPWGGLPGLEELGERHYSLIFLPKVLYGSHDNEGEKRPSYIAYPKRVATGSKLVYPNRSSEKGARNLLVIVKQDGDLWTRPALLSAVVNTANDEVMPILDTDGKTMYFSSSGLYGMGGLDIFRTQYDATTGQWSPPENLGFPYNTPFNDYMVGTPDSVGTIVIASDRNISPDSLRLYTLQYDRQAAGQPIGAPEDLRAAALFEHSPRQREVNVEVAAQRLQVRSQEKGGHSFQDVENGPDYQLALANGYAYQHRADSLRVELEALRERLWNVKSASQRKQLGERIGPLENAMLKAQKHADMQFIHASRIEQEYITGKRPVLKGTKPSGAFADDAPRHLYQAQLANTVFQPDEERKLAAFARLEGAMWQELRLLFRDLEEHERLESKVESSTAAIAQSEAKIEGRCKRFVQKYSDGIATSKDIYSQCLAVALMKSQRNHGAQVLAAERKARSFFRMAQALRNNTEAKVAGQTQMHALALELLGMQYLELGYAFAWSMEVYRGQLEQRITSTEQLLGIEAEATEMQHLEVVAPPVEEELPKEVDAQGEVGIAFDEEDVEGLSIVTPNPYSSANPVPKDIALPVGVVYSLQLGAYSNPIDPVLFRGMSPVRAETVRGGKITKYYAGLFRFKSEAEKGKQITAQCGFPGAFVVAWHNGRSISITRAVALEKLPATRAKPQPQEQGEEYSVFIGTFSDAMPVYLAQTLQLLAPGRKPSRKQNAAGHWDYAIGPFDSRAHAERLRDNLLGSGQVGAKVVEVKQ